MKLIAKGVLHGAALASLAFILTTLVFGIAKDSSWSSLDIRALIEAVALILLFVACYNLEGIQQAANSASDLDENVIEQVTNNRTVTESILFTTNDYDSFSAIRQILSVLAILASKTLLGSLASPPPAGLTDPFMIALSACLQNSTLQFLAAAVFVAVYLQLLPKRLAKLDPIDYLGRVRRFVARIMTLSGSLGVDKPVQLAAWLMSVIRGKPDTRKEYPLSNRKVLEELGKRNGFYVEHLQIRFRVQESQILATEEAEYRISEQKANVREHIAGITHRLTLGGVWILFDVNSWINGEPVTSHKVEMTTRLESVNRFFKNMNEEIEPDDDDNEDDDEASRESEAADNFAGGMVSESSGNDKFTQLAAHAAFSEPVSRVEKPDTRIRICTELALIDLGYPVNHEYDTRRFQFSVQVPIRKLSVIVTTENGEPPKAMKLLIRDVFDWPEQSIDNFELLKKAELLDGEAHGIRITHMLPYVGNKLTVRVDA